ncbi:MAG: hypothetical protein PHQ23_17670 [Candidatus Wallbacteria bacterium]|nr:hypothetical protein [Candidatus Wallbacteria bacterium]
MEAFWISPDGEILSVRISHVDEIIRMPERFGLTREEAIAAYTRHGEPLGLEGSARDELIKRVCERGWIRIRIYREYVSVTLHRLDSDAQFRLEKWEKWLKRTAKNTEANFDPHLPVRVTELGF